MRKYCRRHLFPQIGESLHVQAEQWRIRQSCFYDVCRNTADRKNRQMVMQSE